MSSFAPAARPVDVVLCREELASGSLGGTATPGAWTKAALNTESIDTGGNCTLASSVMALLAGTYEFEAWKTLRTDNVGVGRLRLRNTSDGTTIETGMSHANPPGYNTVAMIAGRFTIAATKNIELQYYVASSAGVSDLGMPNTTPSTSEVYASIYLRKVA